MNIISCDIQRKNGGKKVLITSITLLSISVLSAVVFVPIVVKFLSGVKRVVVISQKICIVSYLLFLILKNVFANGSVIEYWNDEFIHGHGSYLDFFTHKHIFEFFQSFFYHEFYFMSLLQSFDIFKMVCFPLQYHEFCEAGVQLQYFVCGTMACLFFASESLMHITIAVIFLSDQKKLISDQSSYYLYNKIFKGIKIFDLTKTIAFKLIYAAAVVRLSLKTKEALHQSSQMAASEAKASLHRRLFYFSLIPLFINVLFTFPEVLWLLDPIDQHVVDCEGQSILLRDDVRVCIAAATVTVGSFFYVVGFTLLFPKVRNAITCQKKELE